MDVKRYIVDLCDGSLGMDLKLMPDSEVVLASDYDALAADNARLAGELAEARDKQDRWYSTEARLHGLLIEVCGNKAYGEAVCRLCDPTLAEHNPIIAERGALRKLADDQDAVVRRQREDRIALQAELAEAKSNLELARASAEGAAAALRMCRENEEELIEELAEAKRVRAAAIYEASDARMERDALRVQVAGLKDAIHEALECALPPHAARELRAALAGPTRTADQPSVALAKSCVWSQCDEDGDFYDTGCGHAFSFTDGTPTDNEFTHCCFCGLPLDEIKWTDEDVSVDPDHCPVSTTGDHWVKTDIPGKCVYCGASVPTTAEGAEK